MLADSCDLELRKLNEMEWRMLADSCDLELRKLNEMEWRMDDRNMLPGISTIFKYFEVTIKQYFYR